MTDVSVAALAELVGGTLIGDGDRRITGVADLGSAGPQHIGFVRDAKYLELARQSRAGAVLCGEDLGVAASQIVVADVGVAFAKVALRFHPPPRATTHLVHPTAVVHAEAELQQPVEIAAHAVVGRCRIGAGTVIGAGVSIADGCVIGRDCALLPRAVLYANVQLGDRVVVHSGSVLGSDGFGYANEDSRWIKVPQLGHLEIGDDVEIGANCTIDRGAIGRTSIGRGTKIDNLCHIAHNVVLGEDCALAAGTLIAGSTTFGDRVTCGGHVVLGGHLKIVSDVRIGGNSGTVRDVDEPGDYMGWPLLEKRQFARHFRVLRDLVEMQGDLEELKRQQRPEPAGD